MSETENVVSDYLLNERLKLGREIYQAQIFARAALQLACKSGTAEEILELAISIKTNDKAWHINQEQAAQIQSAIHQRTRDIHTDLANQCCEPEYSIEDK